MKYEVSKRIIKEATKCQHEHACLETGRCGDRSLCAEDYVAGKDLIFLQDGEHQDCPYRMAYGNAQICTCPVRYEIYKKYNK